MDNKKWSKDQIVALIDAYKEERSLYAVNSVNYHNKKLRATALHKICVAVNEVRPNTDEKECQSKWYNLRNQFNEEQAKRRASLKSGAGTDDAYVPNLWYYKLLTFLEEHVLPRKSRASLEVLNSQETQNSVTGVCEDGTLPVFAEETCHENEMDALPTRSQCTAGPSTANSSKTTTNNLIPETLELGTPSTRSTKRRKSNEEQYVGAVESIAKYLVQPTTTEQKSLCPVDACMQFLGSVIKEMQSEEIKIDVMNTLVQAVLNARCTNYNSHKTNF